MRRSGSRRWGRITTRGSRSPAARTARCNAGSTRSSSPRPRAPSLRCTDSAITSTRREPRGDDIAEPLRGASAHGTDSLAGARLSRRAYPPLEPAMTAARVLAAIDHFHDLLRREHGATTYAQLTRTIEEGGMI